jgi:Amt family ammonium transporter
MHRMGALDFAGGNVVHINAGVSGLVLALVLGKRNGYGKEPMIPSSVAFTALGAALAGLTWLCLEWKISGKPTLLDMASGVIAGLVAITPVATLIVVYVTKLICGGLRVDGQDERTDLDSALHGERAFEIE